MLDPPRLRIAFVADCLEGRGGGPVSGRRFVAKLRERHDVTVVSADPPGEGRLTLPALGTSIRRMSDVGFVFARPIRKAICELFAHVDVVHLQYPFWLSFVALAEARAHHLPVISAFHVQPENLLRNVPTRMRWASDALYRLWVDRLYNQSDVVVCPTRFAERKLRAHGLVAPTEVVSNGSTSTAVNQPREASDSGAFLIVMVGRLAPEKRQDVLLKALRHSRHRHHIHVVLAGSGPEEARLKKLAATLSNRVDIGFVPQDRLERLLATCDLFVHCSEVELEGMAVLDAMRAGCPVIVADAPESAASELALDGRFSFPAGDDRALAARIDALIERPELRRAAGDACRRVAQTFSFEASVEKLETIYRTVVRLRPDAKADEPAITLPPALAEP